MAKHRNTTTSTPSSDVKPVAECAPEMKPTEATASVTAAPAVAPIPADIQVQHAWRRGATHSGLQKLWNAMELGRPADAGCPGDEVLQQQREAFSAFARAMLGDDAPVMVVLT